jgi:hypothetical protein
VQRSLAKQIAYSKGIVLKLCQKRVDQRV